ncbi:MAG: pyridoxamine 5'-phosphate oxidase family protein [Anaeromyxobacter sp.]
MAENTPTELLRRAPAATLTANSRRHEGWPAASYVPYALDADGSPLVLLSDIAEHTRNLDADDRVCFFVADAPGEDVRATPRLAIYGRARRLPAAEAAVAKDRYLARNPAAAQLLELDFRLWKIEPTEAQWVGGFAQARWLTPSQLKEG